MTDDIGNPHDRLFREIWSDRDVAMDFLRNYLPEKILKLSDLSSLEICKDSFVEEDLKEYFSDLLYRMKLEKQEGYIYLLFEHKSYPEKLIHLQLSEYMLKIWRLHLKQHKTKYIPVIVPAVLYHGKRKWNAKIKFSGMFSGPVKELSEYIPDFEYVLYDLSRYSDDEIKGTVLSRAVMLLMKHISDPDLIMKLPGIFLLMRDLLRQDTGLRYIETILRYLYSAAETQPEEIINVLEQTLSEEGRKMGMTAADILRKEGYDQANVLAERLRKEGYDQGVHQGIQQGIQQGICEGLVEGIELGLSLKFGEKGLKLMPRIRKIQDIGRLKALKDVIRTAGSAEEFKKFITD